MKGYLLNFYKHSPLSESILDRKEMRNRFSNEFVRNIVWSTFDRLEIREIKEFSLFRKPQDSEKHWVGERQFSMIYEPTDNGRLEYINNPDNNKCKFAFEKRNGNNDQMMNLRFFGVSIIDFTSLSYDRFFAKDNAIGYARDVILKSLDDLCEKNNISAEDICFDVYGSLGGSDAVVVWLSKQFQDIIVLAESLRNSKIINLNEGIVSNIYTILGIRDINDDRIKYDDVKGEFHIHLTKRTGCDIGKFQDKLCEILNIDRVDLGDFLYTLAGEHDIMINVPGEKFVPKLYSDDGLIHMNSEIYYKNFIQANTEVSISGGLSNIFSVEINLDGIKQETFFADDTEIFDLVDKICESDMLKKTPYLADTLWILYSDYLRNISSAFSYPWTQDLSYQFKSCLMCLLSIISNCKNNSYNQQSYESIEFIIKNLRQVILHIAQANRIFFEVPNTHLKHTGTYSKILRAYQGITKKLIKQAYLIPKVNGQKEIVPFISFDTIPIPVSFFDDNNNCDKLLVEIKLPYEALVDIKRYSFLLAHEIFHYISPSNRQIRNEIMAVISIAIVISSIICQYINYLMKLHNLSIKTLNKKAFNSVLKNIVSNYIVEHILNNFEIIRDAITGYNSKKSCSDYMKDICENYIKLYNNEAARRNVFEIFCELDYSNLIENLKAACNNSESEENKKSDTYALEFLEQLLQDVKINRDFEDFSSCLSYKIEYVDFHKAVHIFEHVMTEVMADYYMIQILKMDKNLYFKEILRVRSLLYYGKEDCDNENGDNENGDNENGDNENIDHWLRIALIYNYCFIDKNGHSNQIDKIQWEADLMNFILSCTDDEQEQNFLWEAISSQRNFMLIYNNMLTQYFSLLDFNEYEKDGDFLQSAVLFRSKLNSDLENDIESNVSCIEKFQIQESLQELSGFRRISDNDAKYTFEIPQNKHFLDDSHLLYKVAYNFDTLIKYINDMSTLIRDNETEELWYRGHEKDSYKLIPTLYRMGDDGKFFDLSLRDTMEDLFRAFKVLSFSMSEILGNGNSTTIGTMASMQHYSLPTNILDWSPSVLTAIYFAVESYIIATNESQCKEYSEIYLLNPARLNAELRKQLGYSERICPVSYVMDDEEDIKSFLPLKRIDTENKCMSYLPMPVYVPYVNQRIKAQNGTFTMFSLDVDISAEGGKKDFSFMDLFEQQMALKKKDPNFKAFLSKVRITPSAKLDIANRLKAMGIKKHSIYPELENLVKDFKTQIKDFMKSK